MTKHELCCADVLGIDLTAALEEKHSYNMSHRRLTAEI